jgi:hypothetical protein
MQRVVLEYPDCQSMHRPVHQGHFFAENNLVRLVFYQWLFFLPRAKLSAKSLMGRYTPFAGK